MFGKNESRKMNDKKKLDPNAIILMISALGEDDYVDDAIEAGADEYLWKPFTVKNLLKTLDKIFE